MEKLSDEVINQRYTTFENLHELYEKMQRIVLDTELLSEKTKDNLLNRAIAEQKNVTFENMTSMEEIQALIRTYEAFRNELIDLKILDWEKKVYTII